jgi:hypothetical protein
MGPIQYRHRSYVIKRTMYVCMYVCMFTIKRTIVIREYSNEQQVELFSALWSEQVHRVMEPGFQSSLHFIRMRVYRRKDRFQREVLCVKPKLLDVTTYANQ